MMLDKLIMENAKAHDPLRDDVAGKNRMRLGSRLREEVRRDI